MLSSKTTWWFTNDTPDNEHNIGKGGDDMYNSDGAEDNNIKDTAINNDAEIEEACTEEEALVTPHQSQQIKDKFLMQT